MAGRGDILAGKAAVELSLKDKLTSPLMAARDRLNSFAGAARLAGGALSAVASTGAAALAGLAEAAKVSLGEFARVGSEFSDMSMRTGVSAANLQTWTFAAKQSGASAEDLERALRSMAKNGFSVSDFEAIGRSIAAIQDPSERAAKAIEVFGKTGTRLLPMLAEFRALKAASAAAGEILTEDEVRRADALGDAFSALEESLSRIKQQVGAGLAPQMQSILEVAIGMSAEFSKSAQSITKIAVEAAKLAGSAVVPGAGMIPGAGLLASSVGNLAGASLSAFQHAGHAAVAPNVKKGGGFEDETAFTTEKTKQLDMAKSIEQAERRRLSLMQEFLTPAERLRAKQLEIVEAIKEVNRNRVLGFISSEQAAAEKRGLETALARATAAGMERKAKGGGSAGGIDKLGSPDNPRWAEDVLARAQQGQVASGFSGAGLALGAQRGGSGPGEKQLKAAEAALKIHAATLATLKRIDEKTAPGLKVTA